jgi:hypothetical protein
MLDRDEFYVGYEAKAPRAISAFVRRAVIGGALVAVAVAAVLIAGQQPFPAAVFEFGTPHSYEGVIEASPYPSLLTKQPDGVFSRQLLVAPGKHGADSAILGMDGLQVRLDGTRIARDGRSMIEIKPETIQMLGGRIAGMQAPSTFHGAVTLRGEIVDSKCWMGVMNPGSGKVHQDCAARCLSGGIPPLFVSGGEVYVLTSSDGRAIGREVAHLAARPIEIQGLKIGDSLRVSYFVSGRNPSPRATISACQRRRKPT